MAEFAPFDDGLVYPPGFINADTPAYFPTTTGGPPVPGGDAVSALLSFSCSVSSFIL